MTIGEKLSFLHVVSKLRHFVPQHIIVFLFQQQHENINDHIL